MIKRAVIISTGDELTTGRVVDTNANYLAQRLLEAGVELAAVLTVGDVPERLEWVWRTAIELADLVISTGGIGPTADDLTTEAVARVAGKTLVFSEETAARMRRFFAALGHTMPENNLKQALIPADAAIIPNPVGTAPGYRLKLARNGRSVHLVVLPGVPREMKSMMEATVVPWLVASRDTDTVFATRTFQTFGLSESALDEMVSGLVRPEEGRLSFRASFPQISVRVTVEDRADVAERRVEELAERIRARVGPYAYAEGETTMEELVGRLFAEKNLTMAVAESCTGGLIAHRLTNVPGSSRYFRGSMVTYSNDLKVMLLGVRPETLAQSGAVSEQCVREMAEGARARAAADVAVSTSGIAGPDGGTPEKPVGTVCIGLSAEGTSAARRYQLPGSRDWIKLVASQIALDWLRRFALKLAVEESLLAGSLGRKV